MANPYVGEIRMFGGNFPPLDWMFCDGQSLAIAQYDVLFALIGTTYGGDGQQTFNLPDLRGRAPVHQGPGFVIGQVGGEEQVTLLAQQLPPHTHLEHANVNAGNSASPAGAVPAESKAGLPQYALAGTSPMHSQAVTVSGGGQPHNNMMPFLAVSYIISLYGIFPSQT